MQKWEKKSAEIVFSKYGRTIERRDYILPNGKLADYYVLKIGSPVCVLALTDKNEVILAKQFRVGPEEIIMELPGGSLENGEGPLEAVKRELLEETGYVGEFQFVTRCLDCGYNTADRYCFVATNCKKIAKPQPDENEFIEIVILPLDEFKKYLKTGRLTDAEVAYLGLDHLGLLP
jgi:ADP-ribose pyrophosphatase